MINTTLKNLTTNVNATFGARFVANGDTCLLPAISKTAHRILERKHQPTGLQSVWMMSLQMLAALGTPGSMSWLSTRFSQGGTMQYGKPAYCCVEHPANCQRAG